MEKAAQLNHKMYAELIDRIKNGQPIDDMFTKYDPQAITEILEEAAAKYSGNTPVSELFEKPELFKNVKTKIDPKLKDYGKVNYYQDPKTGFFLPEEGITKTLKNPLDKATDIHESQHIYDQVSRPNVKQPIESSGKSLLSDIKKELEINRKVNSVSDLRGIEEATLATANHFKPDVEGKFKKLKQFINLDRIVKGNPLKMIAPVAIGAAAMGIGEKAMAGDSIGATKEIADQGSYFVPYVGEARMAADLSFGKLGEEPTDPISMKGSVFEEEDKQDREKKFNKTMKLLNK